MDIVYVGSLGLSIDYIAWYSAMVILFSVMLTYEKSRGLLIKIKIVPSVIHKSTTARIHLHAGVKQIKHLRTHVKRVQNTLKKFKYHRKLSFYAFAQLAKKLTKRLFSLRQQKAIFQSNQRSFNFNFSLFKHNYKTKTTTRILNSRIKLYKKLPLRQISRLWGTLNSIDLPIWLRTPTYQLYAWLFGCNLKEMDIEDLTYYRNLSEFFRRKLKPTARCIDESSALVCPCDGKVLNVGRVEKGYLEQVKGVTYSLEAFLGKKESTLKQNANNDLFHCIIYLAPGDYHCFHSPSDWSILYRRHYPGELFSVNPSIARWLQGLFNLNERVVYYGKWKYGFFSMSPVGATNVGSIRIYDDPSLETNLKEKHVHEAKLDKEFNALKQLKGDSFGEFNLGSTIVLVFEAPKEFEFNIKPNEKVYLGQSLGSLL